MHYPVDSKAAISSAAMVQTISVKPTPPVTASDGLSKAPGEWDGLVLIVNFITVTFSAAVGSVSITGTINSGMALGYDNKVLDKTFSGTEFTWFPDFELALLPKGYGSRAEGDGGRTDGDAFDLVIGSGGGVITSAGMINLSVVG